MQRREYDMEIIGNNLRSLRKSKGYSVEDIRQYLCLGSVQAVYKYEIGKSFPPADTLLAIMELYDVEWRDIVERHDGVSSVFASNKSVLANEKRKAIGNDRWFDGYIRLFMYGIMVKFWRTTKRKHID